MFIQSFVSTISNNRTFVPSFFSVLLFRTSFHFLIFLLSSSFHHFPPNNNSKPYTNSFLNFIDTISISNVLELPLPINDKYKSFFSSFPCFCNVAVAIHPLPILTISDKRMDASFLILDTFFFKPFCQYNVCDLESNHNILELGLARNLEEVANFFISIPIDNFVRNASADFFSSTFFSLTTFAASPLLDDAP